MGNDVRLVSHGESIRAELSPDSPAVQGMALAAGLEAWKLAAAFSDPEHLFDHLTLEEIARFRAGVDELETTRAVMLAAMDQYLAYARGVLAGNAARSEE